MCPNGLSVISLKCTKKRNHAKRNEVKWTSNDTSTFSVSVFSPMPWKKLKWNDMLNLTAAKATLLTARTSYLLRQDQMPPAWWHRNSEKRKICISCRHAQYGLTALTASHQARAFVFCTVRDLNMTSRKMWKKETAKLRNAANILIILMVYSYVTAWLPASSTPSSATLFEIKLWIC